MAWKKNNFFIECKITFVCIRKKLYILKSNLCALSQLAHSSESYEPIWDSRHILWCAKCFSYAMTIACVSLWPWESTRFWRKLVALGPPSKAKVIRLSLPRILRHYHFFFQWRSLCFRIYKFLGKLCICSKQMFVFVCPVDIENSEYLDHFSAEMTLTNVGIIRAHCGA